MVTRQAMALCTVTVGLLLRVGDLQTRGRVGRAVADFGRQLHGILSGAK
jgi:hypothetical protein